MTRRRQILGILVFVVIAYVAFALFRSRGKTPHPLTQVERSASPKTPIPKPPQVDPRNYDVVRTKLQHHRLALLSRYQEARTASEKATILNEAREAFVRSIHDEIFP